MIGGDQDSSAKVADAKAAHDAHIKGLMQSMGEFSESRRVAGSVVTGYLDEDAIRQVTVLPLCSYYCTLFGN